MVLFLPQGDYTLLPAVTPGSLVVGETGLEPIRLTVGCRQRICVEPCLQLNLAIPSCYHGRELFLTGSVHSCSNLVTRVTYSLNGDAPIDVCTDCGADPAILLSGVLAPGTNELTVTAYDALGGVASVSGTLHPDKTPPVLLCTPDLATNCQSSAGTPVSFSPTALDDCDGPVLVICTPPSGSLFAPGGTKVASTATDAEGNASRCAFKVTVNPSALSIERAVILRWSCCGMLQYADEPGGPWTDLPAAVSPYCVPVTGAHRYYRTRE